MVKICWQSSVGGIDNPLSARAMYLGSSLYRIHGSNEPETIGQAVSSEPELGTLRCAAELWPGEPLEHDAYHCELGIAFGDEGERFVVSHQASIASQPR